MFSTGCIWGSPHIQHILFKGVVMIWLNPIIPIIAIFVLMWKFHHKVCFKESLLILFTPIFLTGIGYWIAYYGCTRDVEYLHNHAITVVYDEPWNEQVPCRHDVYRTVRDSKGNTHKEYVGKAHSYDVDDHPARYYLTDNGRNSHDIISQEFTTWCRIWGNKTFVDLHRDYHTKDGNRYVSTWDKTFANMFPITKMATYKNKVKNSRSVFNYQKVTEEDIAQYGLFQYHKVKGWYVNPIYGVTDNYSMDLLAKYNALNGLKRQLSMNVLVFKNQPVDAAFLQESLWQGGNKNEFNVCIGLTGENIDWVRVISWTENELLKQEVESSIKAMKTLTMSNVVNYIGQTVPPKFIRKQFADFNYLSVEIPLVPTIIITMFSLVSTIALSIVSYKKQLFE
jgi:hypothetical protein